MAAVTEDTLRSMERQLSAREASDRERKQREQKDRVNRQLADGLSQYFFGCYLARIAKRKKR